MGAITSTALDLITGALRNINALEAGEALNANDAGDALQVLNDLVESLSTDKLFIYSPTANVVAWTPGKYQYLIGNPEQGTFAGFTTQGSPIVTGITQALTITAGINSQGQFVGGTLTDTQSAIPTGTTIVSFTPGTTSPLIFAAPPTGLGGTLTVGWPGNSGLYLITFSDGETLSGAFTNGSTAVTWAPALSGTPTATATVNTTTLTMSANATATAVDSITYTAPGDFAISRPLRIRPGYTRITASGNTGLDYWFDVCSIDDYNEIGYKGVPGPWPYLVSLQPTFPYATLWVYPNPQQAGQVFLWTDLKIEDFQSLTQSINLPQGYSRALKKLLAIELAPEYGKNPPVELMRQAQESRNMIRALNETPVKKMRYDSAIMSGNGRDASFIFHGGFGSNL